MITALEIENYRGIKHCKIEDLKQVNILIGRNNAGKSSILEALYLASAAFAPHDPFHTEKFKIDYLITRRGQRSQESDESLYYNYERRKEPNISIYFNKLKPKISIRYTGKKRPSIITYGDARIESFIKQLSNNFENSKKVEKFFESAVMIDEQFIRMLYIVENALLRKLFESRLDRLLIEVLRDGYELDVEGLTYIPFNQGYQLAVKLSRTIKFVDDLGDGAKYAIVLAMVATTMHDSLLLIEEPECHQHPGGLAKVMDVLLRLVKRNNLQVFMSTHSRELCLIVEKLAEEHGVDVATFFIERGEDGEVSARMISAEDRKILEMLGLDIRFIDVI
ncbi:MAG TPA: DUF2813 domain-containing protein [Candidatus Bathyarchaeota archaeon]|nr:DUF2813 domain-containing protein [Candidatus Bathyarchaeota archaeon]HEX69474.1 DUF2813 domain-containing protein [Candidatus Bathyarchaeota archaeon]